MYQLIGAGFCIAAVAFARHDDPIMGLLLALCAIVWVATTPALAPFRRRSKPAMLIRME
jgi:hypothetical protein